MPLQATNSTPWNDRCEWWEFQSALCLFLNIPGEREDVLVCNKEKHILPYSHVSREKMTRRGIFQPFPTSSLTNSWEKWFVWLVSFKEGHVGWAGPFWVFLRSQTDRVTLTFWFILHDVINLVERAFFFPGGQFNLWGKWGMGLLAISLATDLKQELQINNRAGILIFICLSLFLHFYIVWTQQSQFGFLKCPTLQNDELGSWKLNICCLLHPPLNNSVT